MLKINSSFCKLMECSAAGCRTRINPGRGRNEKKTPALSRVCILSHKPPVWFRSLVSVVINCTGLGHCLKFRQQQPRILNGSWQSLARVEQHVLKLAIQRWKARAFPTARPVFYFKTHRYMGNVLIINATHFKTISQSNNIWLFMYSLKLFLIAQSGSSNG